VNVQKELASKNFARRLNACYKLEDDVRAGVTESLDLLFERLGDDHPQVRRAAGETLAVGTLAVVSAGLLQRFARPVASAGKGERASIVYAIGCLGTSCEGDLLETLLACLTDPDSDVRFQAVASLNGMECRDERFRGAIGVLLGDSDDEVAAVAAGAAADLDLDDSLTKILERWRSADGFAKRHLAMAAAHFGSAEVIPTLQQSARKGIDSIDSIDALVALRSDEAGGGLHALATSWRVHPLIRARAAVGLVEVGHPEAEALLKRYLVHRRSDLRGGTVEWLGRARVVRHIPTLLEILGDPRHPESAQAAFALGLMGDKSVVETLRSAAAGDPRPEVREEATTALETLG
jgi:HEAT repeat protein